MRQWLTNPAWMCRQHLMGEHVEIHMFLGSMNRGVSMTGYLASGFLSPRSLRARHEELVQEMTRRGYKHNSPLDNIPTQLLEVTSTAVVDVEKSRLELLRRCPQCATLYDMYLADAELLRSQLSA